MAFRPSKFHEGLIPEQFSFITGINETLEEKTLIRPHTRYIMAATDYSDGVSFRKLGLSTDGVGYGRLPFDDTAFASGYGRGMGIFQLYGGATNFASYFATPFPTGSPYANTSVNELAQWNFNGTKTSLATLTGPSNNPVNTQLPCHVYANYLDIITDNQYLNSIWNLNNAVTNAPLIQQPAAPSLAASTATAFLYSSQFGSQNSPFVSPVAMCLDSSGNIYVADNSLKTILKFNNSGVQQTLTISGVTLSNPQGVFVDSGNNIYVVDSTGIVGAIYKLNSSGAYQSTFSGTPHGNGLTRITQDKSGNFWVVSQFSKAIYEYNSSGAYQSQIATNGSVVPYGIYFDSSNNMYIACGSNGVQLFTLGSYVSNFTGYAFSTARELTQDASNNFYVTDGTNNLIVVFNSSGVFTSTLGSSGNGNGQFNAPISISYYSNDLYILDTKNYRVQVFASTSAGALTGDYAYCYTLLDVNGNESQPSPLANINSLSDENVQLTVTPGSNVTLSVWSLIRIYRTVSNGSTPITATQNPTFWHVPGLDTPVTSATTYTILDAVPDTALSPEVSGTTIADNYTLEGESAVVNASYANGALQILNIGSVPKFITAWNGQTWGANWNVASGSGTIQAGSYPIRVYWSASNDNSGLSAGNSTNWNSFNYLDIGTLDDGNIIGMWPGLQGVLYIFKEYSTYVIQATGNTSGIIYEAIAISSEYGLYQNTIAEIGGAVIGRTKDNVMTFNGTTYKLLGTANLIRKTVNRCITPEADSGVFDTNKQRYYLAVCDSAYTGSFQTEIEYGTTPTEATSIINCYRNSVLAFDLTTDSFETHHNEPIQVFGKMKDSSGRERIFALGMSSDFFILFEGNFFGCDFSFLGTIPNGDTTGLNIQGPIVTTNGGTVMANSFLAIPYFINSDGTVQFLDFITQTSGSAQASGSAAIFPVLNLLPLGNTDLQFMTMIANGVDTVSAINGNVLTMTNNIYQNKNMLNYSLYDITTGVFYSAMDGGWEIGSTNQTLQPVNIADPYTGINVGDQVILVPTRCYDNLANNGIPINAFMTPPMGSRLNDTATKAFYSFRMQIKGAGNLIIMGFKDGNETYKLGPFNCIPDETKTISINTNPTTQVPNSNGFTIPRSYQQMVYLTNLVGYYYRVMIFMPRSSGWFEIQDFTMYYRLQSDFLTL